mgnify:CR=1 FL=1
MTATVATLRLRGVSFVRDGRTILAPLDWTVRSLNPGVIERTLIVSADADVRFRLVFPVEAVGAVEFASFSGPESRKVVYDTMGGGPEFPNQPGQTFPVGWFRNGPNVVGLIADSPWA